MLNELIQVGLVSKEKGSQSNLFRIRDFVVKLENISTIDKLRLTPRNILAFDAAHSPAGKFFIQRHGMRKFARFVELYETYKQEKITAQMIARELDVTRYEIELLLGEIESLETTPDHAASMQCL